MNNVSVPLRGCGFKIIRTFRFGRSGIRFPSPCGDVVLKLSANADWIAKLDLVSVPLRGCGFKIMMEMFPMRSIGAGFRPLAGMWF